MAKIKKLEVKKTATVHPKGVKKPGYKPNVSKIKK